MSYSFPGSGTLAESMFVRFRRSLPPFSSSTLRVSTSRLSITVYLSRATRPVSASLSTITSVSASPSASAYTAGRPGSAGLPASCAQES